MVRPKRKTTDKVSQCPSTSCSLPPRANSVRNAMQGADQVREQWAERREQRELDNLKEEVVSLKQQIQQASSTSKQASTAGEGQTQAIKALTSELEKKERQVRFIALQTQGLELRAVHSTAARSTTFARRRALATSSGRTSRRSRAPFNQTTASRSRRANSRTPLPSARR